MEIRIEEAKAEKEFRNGLKLSSAPMLIKISGKILYPDKARREDWQEEKA